jgi:hypothetical protein
MKSNRLRPFVRLSPGLSWVLFIGACAPVDSVTGEDPTETPSENSPPQIIHTGVNTAALRAVNSCDALLENIHDAKLARLVARAEELRKIPEYQGQPGRGSCRSAYHGPRRAGARAEWRRW